MDRRRFVTTAGLAALGVAAGGCAARGPASPGAGAAATGTAGAPVRPLAPVRVSGDRVIRTVVGLRPFRSSGFVVRGERVGDKVVIHNYGHGGGGITLSWGTAHLAAEEARATVERRAAVLGCGVVGLTSARLLQRRGWNVTIYARDLPPRTTSNIAGGQWSPFSVYDRGHTTQEFDARFLRAAELAYRYFQDMVGPHYGVRWIENYIVSENPRRAGGDDALAHLFPGAEELSHRPHPFPAPFVSRRLTMFIDPSTFLDALLRDFHLAGGRLVVRELHAAAELADLPEPVVFNCTGLGARSLFDDDALIPVRGQLTVLVPQPEVDYILLAGGLYMMPRNDGILLGGTFERGNTSLEPDADTEHRILDGHARLFGAMSAAGRA